jgi:TonB-dependent receptor
MMKHMLTLAILTILNIAVFANKGIIRGTVIEDATGLTVIGANVMVNELGTGSVTDLDGVFSISLDPGVYSLTISYVGMKNIVIEGIDVKPEGVETLGEIRMYDSSLQLQEVVISAKAVRTTETALVTLKKKSPAMLDGISSSLMKLTGDASAVEAAKRVTGVSIEGGKYVYIRGLGDRYSKTTLNGVDIPGLDPDRNTIQMDIFPTALIDNIIVSKNFTADMPADFTGGLLNVETKDFPEDKILTASLSIGYNPDMNLNSDFLSYGGGKYDFLGFDDGTRELPFGAASQNIPVALNPQFSNDQVNSFVSGFNPELQAQNTTSLLDYSASFSFGNQIKLGQSKDSDADKGTLGYLVSLSYKNDYNLYNDYLNGEYQRFPESDAYDLRYANVQEGQLAEQNTIIGALAVLAYKKKYSKIRLTAMRLQNGESRAGQFMIDNSGDAVGQSGYLGQRDNLEYNQRSLSNLLLNGTHTFKNNGWKLDWRVSPTFSTSDDPDIRVAGLSFGGPTGYQINSGEVGTPSRIWRSLSELNVVGKFDISRKYTFKGADANLKFGGSYTFKERDYEILSYNMAFVGGQQQFAEYDLNQLMVEDNIYPYGLRVYYQSGNVYPNPNAYNSSATNTAFYVSNEASLFSNLKVVLGLRGEKFVQYHTGRDAIYANGGDGNNLSNEKVLDALDLFPSVNMIYSLPNDMNLRFAYSKTIARPSFKELSFAQIIDPLSNRIFNGGLFTYEGDWDGNLVETRINNFDFRWEKFMDRGQLLSVSAFYKQFENPIELVRIPEAQTSAEFQPRNVGNGEILGLEFEVRKNLGFIANGLKNLNLNTNLTFVQSSIEMTETEFAARANFQKDGEGLLNERQMAGQSPVVINIGLVYTNRDNGLDAGIFYNVKGRTLEVVSSGLYPDVYLNSFNSLNFSINKRLGEDQKTSIDFKVSNILNDTMERVFSSYNATDQYFSRYSPGISFSLGLSHKF